MDYQGTIIRPPSEANSIILQVVTGCSHNKCAFCAAYKDKRFALKPEDTVFEDIAFAAEYCRRQRKVFLCDGDVLAISQRRLTRILSEIRTRLPWVRRVGAYANVKGIGAKSDADLDELKRLGLGMVYMGLESGDDHTLAQVNKHGASAAIVRQGLRIKQAKIRLSVTVINGLAGPDRSEIHAISTGRALTAMNPDQAAALSLMLVPGTALHEDWQAGRFILMDPVQMLAELKTMIEHTDLDRGLFLANHASNYLPLRIRFPKDKAAALTLIQEAINGETPIKPEWTRGL